MATYIFTVEVIGRNLGAATAALHQALTAWSIGVIVDVEEKK